VSDYLVSQHALCRSPMTTTPKFDLLNPHKCPDQRRSRAAPNFTVRHSKKDLLPPCGGPDGLKLDRKLIYSRFKPVKSLAADPGTEFFSSCAFSGDNKFLYAGTDAGNIKTWNLQSSEETSYLLHKYEEVDHILFSKDNTLVITSAERHSKLWSVGDFSVMKQKFKNAYHLEFSHLVQDKAVGTQSFGIAKLYDLNTGQLTRTLKPNTCRNGYRANRATFDPTDSLILSDGVLWDYRAPKQLHCFDNLKQTRADVFHPNGLEIIINTEVWDVRTFHLMRTVPFLDQCQVVFNSGGEVIYASEFRTKFQTLDSSDYSRIASINTDNDVVGLCCSWNDSFLAVNEESTVRLYDVGRFSTDEEDQN